MKSIEERAKINATFIGNQTPFDAYIEGAKEQQEIDIECAWNFIEKYFTFYDKSKDKERCCVNKGALTDYIKEE